MIDPRTLAAIRAQNRLASAVLEGRAMYIARVLNERVNSIQDKKMRALFNAPPPVQTTLSLGGSE